MLSDLGLLEAFISNVLLLFNFFPFFIFLHPVSSSCHYPSSSHCPQCSANFPNSLSLTFFTSISWNLGLVDLSLGTTAVKTRKPDPGFVLSQPWIQSPGINTTDEWTLVGFHSLPHRSLVHGILFADTVSNIMGDAQPQAGSKQTTVKNNHKQMAFVRSPLSKGFHSKP